MRYTVPMALLDEIVNAVAMRRRREARRRLVLLGACAAVVAVGGVLWSGRGGVTAALSSQVGYHRVERFADEIAVAARESDVDPFLLASIMYAESRGRVDARSPRDALGLMQLMPSAASDAAVKLGLPPPSEADLLSDAILNIRLGARHLRWLLDQGDMDLEQVLVAYNAGRRRLRDWIAEHGSYAAWRAEQERLAREGERTVGSLEYALGVIRNMDRFRERGAIRAAAGAG